MIMANRWNKRKVEILNSIYLKIAQAGFRDLSSMQIGLHSPQEHHKSQKLLPALFYVIFGDCHAPGEFILDFDIQRDSRFY